VIILTGVWAFLQMITFWLWYGLWGVRR